MRAILRIRKEPHYRRQAFEQGLQRVGFTLVDRATPADASDWLILWNRKRGAEENEADAWERAGGTVIVCENGYLAKTEKTHYAISVHGHNGSGWFPVGDEDRFTPLGIPLREWCSSLGNHIVVREQRGIGSALMASPPQWGRQIAATLQRRGLSVIVAPHPGDKNKAAIDLANIRKACELHTWSSAMGVRAIVEGVPTTYYAPHWICGTGLPGPHVVGGAYREAALHRMSHGQWHFDEIATGEPFARIIENREKASW